MLWFFASFNLDSIVSARDGKKNGVSEKVLSTLLNEMDGIDSSNSLSFSSQLETPSQQQMFREAEQVETELPRDKLKVSRSYK